MEQDIRWKQRFQNLQYAAARLENAIVVVGNNRGNDLLEAGLIQTYEYTFELAWKTLKDFLTEEGLDAKSPKETLRMAFANGYISDGDDWLQALADRNLTTHTYDENLAREVINSIIFRYAPMIGKMVIDFESRL